jgi:hypothetical protein
MKATWRTADPPKDRPFLAKARNRKLQEIHDATMVVAFWHPTEGNYRPVKVPGDLETATTLLIVEWTDLPEG